MNTSAIRIIGSGYSSIEGPDVKLWDLHPDGTIVEIAAARSGRSPSYMVLDGNQVAAVLEEEDVAGLVIANTKSSIIMEETIDFPGSAACHVLKYRNVYIVCSYLSGSVAAVRDDGHILWNVTLPGGERGASRAHWATPRGTTGELYVADLGADAVHRFILDENNRLVETSLAWQGPHGCGPRQVLGTLLPDTFVVLCELDSTVRVCKADASGILHQMDWTRSTTAPGSSFIGGGVLSEDGAIIVPNRGPDTVSIFTVDPQASLHKIAETSSHVKTPRMVNFAASEAGDQCVMIAGQDSGTIEIFTYKNGQLQHLGGASLPHASFIGQLTYA